MRIIFTFFLIMLFNTCKTGSKASSDSKEISFNLCPSDGICSFEVLRNSELTIKTDEYGQLYPEIKAGSQLVLQFEYKRNQVTEIADSGYRELIYLQLNPEQLEMELQNKNLSSANLLFARLCFCRGQTGYYRIQMGALSIKAIGDNTYHINLDFHTDEAPQIINHISEKFKI